MKKLICLISLVVFACALPALAANPFLAEQRNGSIKKAELPTCESKIEGASFSVNDCVSTVSCATTATPGFVVRMTCDYTGSAWAWRPLGSTVGATDLSAYALLAGDADGQTIQGRTGANAARIDVGEADALVVDLVGGGATPPRVGVNDSEAYLKSSDGESYVFVENSGVSMQGRVKLNGCANYGPLADYSTISDPAECDTFFDTTLHATCEYNGSAWVKVADGSTACTAS